MINLKSSDEPEVLNRLMDSIGSPMDLISAFYASRANRISKIIWIGSIMDNIYSYVNNCYDVHSFVAF